MIDKSKYVTWRHLKPGDKIKGWKAGNGCRYAKATVVSVNSAHVTVSVFDRYEEKIDAETAMFEVEMTDKEFRAKHAAGAAEIIKNIQNKLQIDECGYHEMWNVWIGVDPYEMAAYAQKHKFKVVGHSVLSFPKHPMFGGDPLDIGICCEYEDGERFWCHARSSYLQDMVKYYGRHKEEHE